MTVFLMKVFLQVFPIKLSKVGKKKVARAIFVSAVGNLCLKSY